MEDTMKNFTISKKLYSAFAAIIILMIGISSFGIFNLNHITGELFEVNEVAALDEGAMNIRIKLLEARRHEKDFLARKDNKYLGRMDATVEELKNEAQHLVELGETLGVDASGAKSILKDIGEYHHSFNTVAELVHAQGDKKSGIRGEMRSTAHQMETNIKESGLDALMIEYLMLRRHEKDFVLREDLKYIDKANAVLTNIKRITTEKNVSSDLSVPIIAYAEKYLDAFTRFSKNVKAVKSHYPAMRAAAHEIESEAIKLEKFVVAHNEELSAAAYHAKKVAAILLISLSGLTVLVGVGLAFFSGRSITKPLTTAITTIDTGSLQVTEAAEQVSSSSNVLAEGAAEQAASLEETSASLEEISAMTRQNAGNAQEVKNLMNEAKEAVGRSNQSMEQLTSSMDMISKASEETQKIIKTIDEIAFQTNLLSLNAAVEAARAGEAGAGFAVVADEVRSLAIRAAEAAKTTSDLIENSGKEIVQGAGLVEQCNADFTEVAENAGKVHTLVNEIAVGAEEQAQGINQISIAVNEMDRVTQNTASSAEESAAASQELDALSISLHTTVVDLKKMVGGRLEEAVQAGRHQANHGAPVITQERQPVGELSHVASSSQDEFEDCDFEDFAQGAVA
jgi:methyl-accepting chemotaxis protein